MPKECLLQIPTYKVTVIFHELQYFFLYNIKYVEKDYNKYKTTCSITSSRGLKYYKSKSTERTFIFAL